MPGFTPTEVWYIYPDSFAVAKQIGRMLPADAECPRTLCADGMERDLLLCEKELMDRLRNDRRQGELKFQIFKSTDNGRPVEVFRLEKDRTLRLVNHGDPPGAYRKTG